MRIVADITGMRAAAARAGAYGDAVTQLVARIDAVAQVWPVPPSRALDAWEDTWRSLRTVLADQAADLDRLQDGFGQAAALATSTEAGVVTGSGR